ncbi:TPA: DotD/TraH family lipoprotein [Enterobacter hormaechei subsp. steigerwaltii]|nr:DotD/TraH family lipoprotein [Enterobacter hormaechei subsp. steigerwaltii]
MNHLMFPGMLAICLLAGCQSFSRTPPAQSADVADRYGAASSVAVTRHNQYRMWDRGVWSSAQPGQPAGQAIFANSSAVSFDWEGDAVELLTELARTRGLQFNYSGVRLPLPVTLHVQNMTFANVLRLIESQTAWRATLHQYPGLLQLAFMQEESRRK